MPINDIDYKSDCSSSNIEEKSGTDVRVRVKGTLIYNFRLFF